MIPSWRERAACVGADPNIFHRLAAGDPGTESLSSIELKEKEKANFELALKLCSTCSVRVECHEEGQVSVADGDACFERGARFSVWGGSTPERWNGNPKGRPSKGPDDPCKNGHVGMYATPPSGKKYCKGCKGWSKSNEDAKAARAARPAFKTMEEKHEDGTYDHDLEPTMNAGRRVCRVCRNRYNTKSRPHKGPIDYDARHLAQKGHAPEWRVRESQGYRACMICAREADRKRKDTRFNRKRVV